MSVYLLPEVIRDKWRPCNNNNNNNNNNKHQIKSNQIKSNQIKSRASDSTTFSVPISIESNPFVWIIDVNSATIWLHFDDFQLGSVLSQFWAFLLPISAGFDTLLPMVSIRGGFLIPVSGWWDSVIIFRVLLENSCDGHWLVELSSLNVEIHCEWSDASDASDARDVNQPPFYRALLRLGRCLEILDSMIVYLVAGFRRESAILFAFCLHFVCFFFFSRLRSVTLNERRVKIPRRNFLFPFCGDSEVVAAISAQ